MASELRWPGEVVAVAPRALLYIYDWGDVIAPVLVRGGRACFVNGVARRAEEAVEAAEKCLSLPRCRVASAHLSPGEPPYIMCLDWPIELDAPAVPVPPARAAVAVFGDRGAVSIALREREPFAAVLTVNRTSYVAPGPRREAARALASLAASMDLDIEVAALAARAGFYELAAELTL